MTVNRDLIQTGPSLIEGTGVFAKRKIPRGTRIIEYAGERVPIGQAHLPFSLALDSDTAIDGGRNGNDARFVNHSCAPNCEAYVFAGKAYLYAMRDIARGEELTFDYRLAPADGIGHGVYDEADYRCRCGAATCRGTLLKAVLVSALAGLSLFSAPDLLAQRPAVERPITEPRLVKVPDLVLKFSERFSKTPASQAIVGIDNGTPIYQNARNETFYLDPATGDMKFLSADAYAAFREAGGRARPGSVLRMVKWGPVKFGGEVSILGVDAAGHVVHRNSRGEMFYLDPVTGDMVFVK